MRKRRQSHRMMQVKTSKSLYVFTRREVSISWFDFSTRYYLLSLYTDSVSQQLKLDPSSQTSCCIPADISRETWHSAPRNTGFNSRDLENTVLNKVKKQTNTGNNVKLYTLKGEWQLGIKLLLSSLKWPDTPLGVEIRLNWCDQRGSYLDGISSDELLDCWEQAPPSTGRRVLFYFWMPPLGPGWAICQTGVRLLRRLTHSQPHCF